jgi:hypothetical protein
MKAIVKMKLKRSWRKMVVGKGEVEVKRKRTRRIGKEFGN